MNSTLTQHGEKAPPPGVLRVLVVDDNVDACDSTAALLQWKGHETRSAFNGPDALREVISFAPDLVLLDIAMPGMDGLDIARAIHGTKGKEPVIAAVSGYASLQYKRLSAAAGFDHYLLKPVVSEAFDELLLLVREGDAIRDKTRSLRLDRIAACYDLLRAQLEFCGLILDSAAISKEVTSKARLLAKAQRLQGKMAIHLTREVGLSVEQLSSLRVILTGLQIRLKSLQINNLAP